MSNTAKKVCSVFGSVNTIVVLGGILFMFVPVISITQTGGFDDAELPYISYFFFSYFTINIIFLGLLSISTFRLFKFDLKGISLLKLTLKLELIYGLVNSFLWFLPAPYGRCAAAATGIGNMGLSPQTFIAYPITGLIALWILKSTKIVEVETTPS